MLDVVMSSIVRTVPIAIVAALAAIGIAFPGDAPEAADPEALVRGERLYALYCADCHGPGARGDGADGGELRRAPTDLTRLSRANGGPFPEADVRRSIDGRFVPHRDRNREMPIWGFAFQEPESDANQEQNVQDRIDDLIRYLKSIQKSRS
jgi:mono/diheme cytochrome c family protein